MFRIIILVFSFVNFVITNNYYCRLRCDIRRANISHTVCDRAEENCGPASKCGQDFKVIQLNDDDRQYILDIHNYLRNRVALGYEKRGGNQPKAANMMIMKYNRELEFISQCWANACNGNPLRHDRCRRTAMYEYVGQNLAYLNSSSVGIVNKPRIIRDLILAWYDEVVMFNRNWVNVTKDRGDKYQIGHYTQIIWAQTTSIGCAISYFTENRFNSLWHQILFVCNYGPGGNYLGLPVYYIGKPGTKCPRNQHRNSLYKGLCGNTQRVRDVENFNPSPTMLS